MFRKDSLDSPVYLLELDRSRRRLRLRSVGQYLACPLRDAADSADAKKANGRIRDFREFDRSALFTDRATRSDVFRRTAENHDAAGSRARMKRRIH